ncbi:MAG: RHS repeat domain-containing protein [Candidatus Margulisiibacteriota bacterium]
MGRLTQIQFPINGSLRPVVNDIRYNKANLMLGYALPLSNITATQGFDPQNDRIKSIAFTGPTYLSYKNQQNAAILQAMNKLNLPQFNQDPTVTGNALPYFTQTYTYDPAGNRTQLTQKEAADTTQFTYDYDRMNQLVAYAMKVNNADPVEFKYTYDSQGNRTSLTQGTTTLTTDFDTTTNKPNGYWFGTQKNDENHIDFVYDKNGNRTAKQLKTPKNELLLDITYAWNAQNRMTRYTLNGTTQTNRYQFSGPRYEKKETSPEGTETTRFYPDDSLRLLSEKVTDAKGQKSYAYIYLGTQKLARISKNVASQKDEVSYFLNDALGTPAWITYEHTASPNAPVLVSQNLRDPWGNEMGSTLFNQTPVRDFTGKQQDTLSNLYDFGFRYYDSLLGTWIGKDLVPPDYASPLSLNEYLFCLDNPLKYVDLDGRLAVSSYVGVTGTYAFNTVSTSTDFLGINVNGAKSSMSILGSTFSQNGFSTNQNKVSLSYSINTSSLLGGSLDAGISFSRSTPMTLVETKSLFIGLKHLGANISWATSSRGLEKVSIGGSLGPSVDWLPFGGSLGIEKTFNVPQLNLDSSIFDKTLTPLNEPMYNKGLNATAK